MLTGKTAVEYFVKRPAIAFAKTARTSQVKHITKIKNIILILLFSVVDDISAIDLPFSFKLITRCAKIMSCSHKYST